MDEQKPSDLSWVKNTILIIVVLVSILSGSLSVIGWMSTGEYTTIPFGIFFGIDQYYIQQQQEWIGLWKIVGLVTSLSVHMVGFLSVFLMIWIFSENEDSTRKQLEKERLENKIKEKQKQKQKQNDEDWLK